MTALRPAIAGLLLLAAGASAQPQRLTDHPADDRHPVFSPDGERLLFESNRDGDWEVYAMDAAGGALERLTDHPAADRFPAWAPSGERIVFQSDRGGSPALYALEGSKVMPLGVEVGRESFPQVSPDGSAVAYTAEVGANVDLYLLRWGGGATPLRLTRHPARDAWPRFSPDGEWIAFFSRRDTAGEDDEIYVMPAGGGEARRVTRHLGHDFCPTFSPDGRFIAAARSEASGQRFIAVTDLAGELRAKLGEGLERATEPSWSPDGRRIAFAGRAGETYDVYAEEVPADLRPDAPARAGCCTEKRLQKWLQACAWLASEIPEGDVPGSPTYGSNVHFYRPKDLAPAFVAACLASVGRPGSLPEGRLSALEMASSACCRGAERTSWLAACVNEARAVRPGDTRASLDDRFEHDGGLHWRGRSRYLHRRCRQVKLRIELAPAGLAPESPEAHPGDLIVEVFGPYVGPIVAD